MTFLLLIHCNDKVVIDTSALQKSIVCKSIGYVEFIVEYCIFYNLRKTRPCVIGIIRVALTIWFIKCDTRKSFFKIIFFAPSPKTKDEQGGPQKRQPLVRGRGLSP